MPILFSRRDPLCYYYFNGSKIILLYKARRRRENIGPNLSGCYYQFDFLLLWLHP